MLYFFKVHSQKWILNMTEVAPDLYEATIWPSMVYCCHGWAGIPNCNLGMLNNL